MELAEFIRAWLADEANQPDWGAYVPLDEPLHKTTIDGMVDMVGLATAVREFIAAEEKE